MRHLVGGSFRLELLGRRSQDVGSGFPCIALAHIVELRFNNQGNEKHGMEEGSGEGAKNT
jgi:hypothetical protein